MTPTLADILRSKRDEVAERKRERSSESLREGELYDPPRRSFVGAFPPGRLGVIAEVKKASPSKGVIREAFDHLSIALGYESGGAAAISVLTDKRFFQGDRSYLSDIRKRTGLPLLMKDFIVDQYQVEEARAFGADAILLIVAALDGGLFTELLAGGRAAGLEVLVEVHNEVELERALAAGASLIGVNNRDLHTFETHIETSERLARMIPPGCIGISESGIGNASQGIRLRNLGYRGILIGETFMRADDPGRAVEEFVRGVGGVRVKICGVTRAEDAEAAVECGASALGFIFVPGSARQVEPKRVRQIVRNLPPGVETVGVFMNANREEILRTCAEGEVTSAQIHGEEPPSAFAGLPIPAYKAFRVAEGFDPAILQNYPGPRYLLDGPKGGRPFDWKIARDARRFGQIILAGGITPENVAEAVATAHPYAIDVSSGVESSPGIKSLERMRNLFDSLRALRAPSGHLQGAK